MLIIPDASDRSRQLLRDAIRDQFRITMLIIGDGPGMDVIASKADVRAQALPSTRRVVWIRDQRVVEESDINRWTKGGTAPVCALDLDERPVAWLTAAQANSFTMLERAFARAQQGEQ